LQTLYPADIFTNDIELHVHQTAWLDGLDIGMFESIRDNGHVKPGFFNIEDREADAIQADGALFYHEMAEFFGKFEAEFPTAVELRPVGADARGIYMTLDDMAVKATIHWQTSFQVDEVTGLPAFEVGFFQGLFDGRDPVGAIHYFLYRETDAVVGYALVDL